MGVLSIGIRGIPVVLYHELKTENSQGFLFFRRVFQLTIFSRRLAFYSASAGQSTPFLTNPDTHNFHASLLTECDLSMKSVIKFISRVNFTARKPGVSELENENQR
jgi:hypothetical protein